MLPAMVLFNKHQDDTNKRLTITSLKTAVKSNKIEQVRNSLAKYGLPRSAIKTTDYLILQMAIKSNFIEIAKLLINAGCRVNMKDTDDRNEYTPLELAIQAENEEIVTLLLQKGANLQAKKKNGLTVLHIAAKQRSLKMLNFLLQYSISLNHSSSSGTPFQVFLENCYRRDDNKNIEIFKFFLTKEASINFKTSQGDTVLHHVVRFQSSDIIQHVLKLTNDVNVQNNSKNTPLHYLLNEYKSTTKDIVDVVKQFILKGAKVDIQNNNGDTVCHLAAKKKYLKILQIFLHCQWNVNCSNEEGNTVLHCISMSNTDLCSDPQYLQTVNTILNCSSLKLIKNNRGSTPLHIAAEHQQIQILNTMLSKSVDINATDEKGNTILYIFMKNLAEKKTAPCKDGIEIVKRMISLGATLSTNPSSRECPLHYAFRLGNKEIISHMMECSFNYDEFDRARNRSILHLLIHDEQDYSVDQQLYNVEVAEICIKKGANVNVQDSDSKTPLYLAVLLRNKQMVKMLLDYGANPNVKDSQGGTILENLMKHEVNRIPRNTISRYSAYGLNHSSEKQQISIDIQRDTEIAQMLLSQKAVAENVSEGQVSIFHYCAINSHLNMLSRIISYSKDPNIRDSRGNTILQALLTHNLNANAELEKKITKIVVKLLSKGANVTDSNEKGETSLHLAAKAKNLEVSKLLVQQSVNIADLDKDGNSVLHFLCMLQSKTQESVERELTELFVKKGCDVNAKNNKGMTPFLSAAQSGSINMIRILRELNANINCHESGNLSTPLHLAAENNHQEVIEQLIQYGVDVNIRQKDRKTALHLSVAHNLPKVTRLLLEAGADTYMKDSEAKTPLHWACWHESLDNINELLEYGADLNVEDNFNVTPLMLTRKSSDVWTKLRYHVIKLRAASMPVSSRNESYLIKCDQEHRNYSTAAKKEFETAATEESLRMEKVPIGPRMSLADVLLMSADKLSIFKNNENFQKLLYSANFKEKYPIYADLVRACYRKGIIRSDLMLSAKDAFRKILGLALPDTCCDDIFYYLDNENLDNLDKAAKVKLTKRKRFLDEIHEGIPAKRVRRISV